MRIWPPIVIGVVVFAAANLAEAFFGVGITSRSTSSGEPAGFEVERFLLSVLMGAIVGGALAVFARWRNRRKQRSGSGPMS